MTKEKVQKKDEEKEEEEGRKKVGPNGKIGENQERRGWFDRVKRVKGEYNRAACRSSVITARY